MTQDSQVLSAQRRIYTQRIARAVERYERPIQRDPALKAEIRGLEDRIDMRAWLNHRRAAVERGGYD